MRINRKSKTTILIVLLFVFFLWVIMKAKQNDNLDRIRTIFELCNKYPNDLGKPFLISYSKSNTSSNYYFLTSQRDQIDGKQNA